MRRHFIDLTGRKFGRLTVVNHFLDLATKSKCLVRCDCGKEKTIRARPLIQGFTRSCGCLGKESTASGARLRNSKMFRNLVGAKFCKWTVVSQFPAPKGPSVGSMCGCLCECGRVSFVDPYALQNGRSKSCGCLHRDLWMLTGIIRGFRLSFSGEDRESRELLRSSTQNRVWATAVRERDNFTCQICGCHGHIADHIKKFSEYPELRFELSNGRTLCKRCHLKTDNYGNRKQKIYDNF